MTIGTASLYASPRARHRARPRTSALASPGAHAVPVAAPRAKAVEGLDSALNAGLKAALRALIAVACLTAATALPGCAESAAGAPEAAAASAAPAPAPRAEFLQAYRWEHADAAFGGFSGFDFIPGDEGRSFVTISDRTTMWDGRLERDATGRITDVTVSAGPLRMRDAQGAPMTNSLGDAEGLALAPDGRRYVSFEGEDARVSWYAPGETTAHDLPRAEDFAQMRHNGSLEALAIDTRGRLYTLPEESLGKRDPFPVYRFDPDAPEDGWSQPFALPRDGRWLAVGADIGPDGRFYLLERDFWGFLGFLSRVRVFDLPPEGGEAGVLTNGRTLFQTRAGRHDNLEGLTVWRDDDGAIRLTMISDDNFLFLQRTEIVEYRVID